MALQSILAGFSVDRFLGHWRMFPTAILFSLVALATGVSGALFSSPFFVLVVGLSPSQAIGAGFLTEVFGMDNGLLNDVRQRVVDFAWSAPGLLVGGTVGTRVSKYVPSELMEPALGVVFATVGVIVLASELFA